MADLRLRTVTDTQGATLAIKDGSVTPGRYAFEFEEVPVIVQAFRRMVRGLEFDVSEMAFTTYLCAKAHGKPFTALPIFLVRGFHHGAIVRGTTGAARSPKDLEGRRVGVNRGYTVTTGVWVRGILQDEYGVDLSRVTWVLSGDEHVAEYRPPPNVVPLEPGGDLAAQVGAGDLAAGIGVADTGVAVGQAGQPGRPGQPGQSGQPGRPGQPRQAGRPGLEPLIPDAEEAGFDALRQRGLYPINHLIVVRDDLLNAHPDLAASIFTAYARAKSRYIERLGRDEIDNPTPVDVMYRRVMAITGTDPLPYGIEPNRAMIEQLIRHAVTQRILDGPPAVETLFPESTQDLAG